MSGRTTTVAESTPPKKKNLLDYKWTINDNLGYSVHIFTHDDEFENGDKSVIYDYRPQHRDQVIYFFHHDAYGYRGNLKYLPAPPELIQLYESGYINYKWYEDEDNT